MYGAYAWLRFVRKGRGHHGAQCRHSGTDDRSGPYPRLVLVGRNSEPDLDSAWCPGDDVAHDQLLHPVLPDDPCGDPHGFADGGDAGMGELLWREGPRLSMCSPRDLGHLNQAIEQKFDLAESASATRAGKGTTGGDQLRDVVEGVRDQAVVGPLAALLAGEDAGVDEDLEVVGDGGLG